MTETKSITQSKTFWFNALTILSVVLGAVAVGIGDLPISHSAEVVTLFVISLIQPAVNVVLRLRTHTPIEGSIGARRAEISGSTIDTEVK